jgi:DNA-binding SARP family transcriptional activator
MGELRETGNLFARRLGAGMNGQVLASQATAAGTDWSADSDQLHLRLLGGFGAVHRHREVQLPVGTQRLVAFLALHSHPLPRARVAASLWPDSTEARSAASLRSALWRLRRPGLRLIQATDTHLRLADHVTVDTREVVATVRRLTDQSAPCLAGDLDAVPLSGELLPDWPADFWIQVERERFRQLCLHGLEAMCGRLLTLGRYGDAIEAALAAVRGEPLRESAHRVLISIHLAEGNHVEALRQYQWYERILHEELGIEPSPQITRLVGDMRRTVAGLRRSPVIGMGATHASRHRDACHP